MQSPDDVEELQGVLGLALQLDTHGKERASAAGPLHVPCQAPFTSMLPNTMRLAHRSLLTMPISLRCDYHYRHRQHCHHHYHYGHHYNYHSHSHPIPIISSMTVTQTVMLHHNRLHHNRFRSRTHNHIYDHGQMLSSSYDYVPAGHVLTFQSICLAHHKRLDSSTNTNRVQTIDVSDCEEQSWQLY